MASVMAEQQADLARAMALRRADLDCMHQKIDRMHMVLDRAQFQRLRVLERARVRVSEAAGRRTIVVCPKTGRRITVKADGDFPDMDTEIADIEVGDSF